VPDDDDDLEECWRTVRGVRDPREMTVEEVRVALLEHIWTLVDYYDKLKTPETPRERLAGLASNILSALDGGPGDLPPFIVAPDPHPDDKPFRRELKQDWFPENLDVEVNAQLKPLHEFWHAVGRKRKHK